MTTAYQSFQTEVAVYVVAGIDNRSYETASIYSYTVLFTYLAGFGTDI